MAQKNSNPARPTIFQIVLMGVGLALSIALYVFSSGFVSCWRLTSLPGFPPPSCPGRSQATAVATNSSGTPTAPTVTPTISAPEVQLPDPWDGASRVNVLVLGLRGSSDNQGCPLCTDTMILLTIDPVSKTAGMLSIPRDMWANIPGFGYNRINAAYTYGELYKLPGGGPGLTIKTVENFLGIPIQYYAQVGFSAFATMIDDIGGICFEVPAKVDVGVIDATKKKVTVVAGYNCMSGKLALGYARARDVNQGIAGGDVERSQNQQLVILAVRDKVLSNLPTLVTKAVPLYNAISSDMNTNLSLDDILRLAMLAKDIPASSIQEKVIDYTMMKDVKTVINGQEADVLRPFPDKIRELVDEVFGGGTLQPEASGNATQLMQQEAAHVLIVDGSGVNGIAEKTYNYLKAQGMDVLGPGNMVDNPDKYKYPPLPTRSMIIVHTGKPYTIKYLMSLMKFDSANQLAIYYDPTASADIVLAIGTDWTKSNPMP